jgi:hypothetical protein
VQDALSELGVGLGRRAREMGAGAPVT